MPRIQFGSRSYRFILFCLLGLIGAGLLPTLVMRAMGWNNGFWLVANMWRGEGGGDSWDAIINALGHLDTRGTDQFYEVLYYNSSHQFIYSPLSLVFFRLTQFPPFVDWYSASRMNNASWWVMVAMIVAMTLLMRESSIRYRNSHSAPNLIETIGMAILAVIAISTFAPIIGGFRNGQIQTWLDFLALVSLLLMITDRRVAAGACIGLICIVKPQLAILFAWAGLRRDWWFLAGGLTVAGAFGAASIIEYGWRIQSDYLSLVLFLSRRGESYEGNQSLNGLLNRMFFLGPNVIFDSTHTHIVYNVWVWAATTISSASMIVAALFIRSRPNTLDGVLDLCTALLIATLASPVAYTHHYGLILPVFWLLLLRLGSEEKPRVMLYCLLALSYALFSDSFAILSTLADTHWNFLQSMPMFGAFILMGLLFTVRAGLARSTATDGEFAAARH
jgi:alpha-1,2-mannosyltransferase